ncbi:MAG: GspH/FimT family pseudopilin [Desulfobacterales bacterium]
MNRRDTQTGFTILELIVSVAILGILAGIAIPNYLTYIPKARLNGAARMVLVDLMAARMKAVKTNRKTQIVFIDDHQYRMNDDADGNNTVDNPEGDATLRDIQSAYYDVTLSWTAGTVSFSSRGTTSGAGTTVTVTNPSGAKNISVAITGRVKIS